MRTPAIAVIASLCLMGMPFCHAVLAGDSSVDRGKERVLENAKETGLNSDTPPPEIKQTPEPGPTPVLQDFGESRPGYRPTVTKFSQEFYRYIMDKAGRGETISQSESIMIQYMISTRSWPEAPKINANDKAAARWIAQHDTIVANATEGLRSSGGKLDYDMERPKLVEQFRNYYFSLPPDKRNWVSNRMMDYYKSLGYDMRSDQVKETDRKRIEDRERKDKEAKNREKKRKDIEQENKKAKDQAAKDKQVFDDWKAKEARERLTKAIKGSKANGPKKKSWDEMSPEEKHAALKNNESDAWAGMKKDVFGDDGKGDSSQPYNPLNDPNLKTKKTPVDLTDAKTLIDDFQKRQWKPLDTRDQKIKDRQPGQSQPPEYLRSSTTTTITTAPPEDTTTPATVTPPTTTTGVTSKDLTDVTVDRMDVNITVWDHGTEDGDIINIYLNGKVLKSNLLLTRKKQSFQVKLSGGQNRFEVEAVNEGSTPPNTATVEISNVTKGKPSQVYERKTGQRASMILNTPTTVPPVKMNTPKIDDMSRGLPPYFKKVASLS